MHEYDETQDGRISVSFTGDMMRIKLGLGPVRGMGKTLGTVLYGHGNDIRGMYYHQ